MRAPSPRRRRAAPLLGAAAAALLLTACSSTQVNVPWLHFSVAGSEATPEPSAEALATPPADRSTPDAGAPTIEQFIPVAESFVAEHRGHAFKTPVQVTLLDDAAFRRKLLGDTGGGTAIADASKELKALHLIAQGVDLNSASDDLLGAGVSGFYDPKAKALYVRGVSATPYVRQVLVHELTHALQDQYFSIDRPNLDKADDEQAAAFQAVVEGDAVRIEDEYHAAMSASEQDEADREEQSQAGGIPGSVPPVLIEMLTFPYIAGPRFVDALDHAGGNPEVDQAFLHPPVSSEQILDVNAYLAGRQPRTVPVPHADGTPFDHGVNGEFGLILLFEAAGDTPNQARSAADLWGGDAYVAWNHGSGACVRMAVIADRAADQADLDSALGDYAHSVGASFTASRGGAPSVLTACG